MIRPTLILAALAALCAPSAFASATYRIQGSAIACERAEQIEKLVEIASRPKSEENRKEFTELLGALRQLGICVAPREGTEVVLIERRATVVQVRMIAVGDPRYLWTDVLSIDWSAR